MSEGDAWWLFVWLAVLAPRGVGPAGGRRDRKAALPGSVITVATHHDAAGGRRDRRAALPGAGGGR